MGGCFSQKQTNEQTKPDYKTPYCMKEKSPRVANLEIRTLQMYLQKQATTTKNSPDDFHPPCFLQEEKIVMSEKHSFKMPNTWERK